jgi:YggT family protein
VVDTIRFTIYYALLVFGLLLIVRVVTELARMFLRSGAGPTGWAAAGLEFVYLVTDPSLRLLRKLIPTIRMSGGVGLNLSVSALFFVVIIVMQLVRP